MSITVETLPEKATSFNVRDEYQLCSEKQLVFLQRCDVLPFAVAMINTKGDLNVGTTIRSACLLGASEFFLFGRRAFDRRSSVGAHHYIPLHRFEARLPDDAVDMTLVRNVLHEYGYVPVFIEQTDHAYELTDYTIQTFKSMLPLKPCIVVGPEEGGGMSRYLTFTDRCYVIRQRGVLRSFNVSHAAVLAMHHVSQLLEKDHYGRTSDR